MASQTETCLKCGELNPPSAKFCMECGTRLGDTALSAAGPAEERRVVTVVFADLSGFTAYSERTDIEEVRALAHEAAQRMGEIVERYGGTVDKVLGDAVMAVFGAPTSHEDDPERAVRAALDMNAYAAEHQEQFARLPLTIGINTGEAMFAPVGSAGQFTVIGDTVNTAARLQSAAGKGEILVGQPTYLATEEVIEYESVDPIVAKNKAEPVLTWKALSVKGAKAVRTAPQTAWVGRSAEFERIWELWERIRTERQPHTAYILGPPGIGKSRLISEFIKRVEGSSSVYWGRCLSYGEGITYWPVIEIIKGAAGIVHDDELESVSRKLGTFLEDLGSEDLDELRTMAVALANLVAAPTTPRGTYQATKITQGELHWGLRRVFQLLSAREPVVLVFEDLHWAEPTLLEMFDFILEEGDFPLMILGSARPELKETFPQALEHHPKRRVIEIEALTEEESFALIAELTGEAPLDEKKSRELLKAAAGNPLFLEETIRMLAEIAMSTGVEIGKGESLPVPRNLRSLIGSRLDRLTSKERKQAQSASVIGHVFWSGAVAFLMEDGANIDAGLGALQVRDLVHEQPVSTIADEREWAFKHAMIRDVAYDRLPKSSRANLHTRSGKWIAALPGSEEDFSEIVAFHLERACRLAAEVKSSSVTPPLLEAVKALTRAGEKAESREGTREADRFYERALELLGNKLPETAAELQLRRARATAGIGDLNAARTKLEEVAGAALKVGRSDLRCGALLTLGYIAVLEGKGSEARERLTEAHRLAAETSDPQLQIRAELEFATFREHYEGSPAAAAQALRAGIVMAEKASDHYLQVIGRLRLGTLLVNAGKLAEAEVEFLKCIELAGGQGSIRDEARATYFLSDVKFYEGDMEEAERLALRSLDWFERAADRPTQLQNLKSLARLGLATGAYGQAEQWLRRALPLAIESGGWLASEIYRYLAETLAHLGRPDEAREAAESARSSFSGDYLFGRAVVLLADGFAAVAEEDSVLALGRFGEAVTLLEEQGFGLELGDAEIAFARVLARFGDGPSARNQLDAARSVFVPMGARGRIEEIDRELASLGSDQPR